LNFCKGKGITQAYFDEHKVYYANCQEWKLDNVFSIFAKRNQCIRMDAKPIKNDYSRLHRGQKSCCFKIYSTDNENPLVVDHTCRQIISLEIEFPANNDDLDCSCEFDFSDTVIRVFAYPASRPNARKEVTLNYEFDETYTGL